MLPNKLITYYGELGRIRWFIQKRRITYCKVEPVQNRFIITFFSKNT